MTARDRTSEAAASLAARGWTPPIDTSSMTDEELAEHRRREEAEALAVAETASREPLPRLAEDERHLIEPFLKNAQSAERSPVHFPSDRFGLTWCGLPFASPGGSGLSGVDRNGLRFSTAMADITCPACASGDPVYPEQPADEEPEVVLARLALQVDTRMLPPAKWKALREVAELVLARRGMTS